MTESNDVLKWKFQAVDAEIVKKHLSKIGDLPNDYYHAIGRITVSFALLEHTVCDLCGLFINNDQQVGQIVTSEFAFRRTLTMLSALVRHHIKDESKVDTIYEVVKKAEKIEDDRNQVLHSMWWRGEDDTHIKSFKVKTPRKRGLEHTFGIAELPYLHSIADDIISINKEFEQLFAPRLTREEAEAIVKQQTSRSALKDDKNPDERK